MARRRPRYTTNPVPVESIAHTGDTRANIPTAELADFVRAEDEKPKYVLYPRDPSLDPQLVWKGKDEQDSSDLEVPAVPIYIQEHIKPQAIIEDLRREQAEGKPRQANMFSDFNGMPFSDRIDFYRHPQNWTNRMILGDSLLAMTSLAEKEGLKSKVQMIYMDPPYGIRFGSNWQVSTRKRDLRDGRPEDATREPEQIRAFRDTWKLGIHSYLAYWRDRLLMAKDLLTETGSIFVQIGDENVHLVRAVLDEVFGSDNFISQISFAKTTGFSGNYLSNVCDYLVWYGKSASMTKFRQLYKEKEAGEVGASAYRPLTTFPVDRDYWKENDGMRLATSDQLTSKGAYPAIYQHVTFKGREFVPPAGLHWKTTTAGLRRLIDAGRIFLVGNTLRYLRLIEDFNVYPISNTWTDTGIAGFTADRVYVVQTLPKVIERCLLMTTDPGDLVIDPTCGSGTTAFVAEQWGRRWVTIDTSRVAIALARTRLMSARFPYYLLADTPEGIRKEAGVSSVPAPSSMPQTEGDIKKGFVYKRVPHITLEQIANNPDIKDGMTREEIDAAIARHAESETLFDQPYENNRIVRVTGPFTVESLSPHRVLTTDEERPKAEAEASKDAGGQFETMIIENLRKAGVQNTVKNERLTFDRLDAFAGEWLHASGEYTENPSTDSGQALSKRVAVCIGPEHGTVGPELIKEAAKEAVRGLGFDLLVVCGFAFDPYVSEEAKQYGPLRIQTAKINPDLQMGDEFLKRTGAGNLFMVFGEPDIDISREADDKLAVEIRGLDVYDPTTGQIRSHSTDDIACWFIDTDYNEEAFFVRHAYFCGGDEPYDRLKRALRAEIDEAAWSSLYATKSRPFDPPTTGKIAIKVINHYGDEVLKVYQVS